MNTFDKIKKIIVEFGGFDDGRVTPEAELYGDLDLDSLDQVQIVMEIEDELGVMIPDDVLEKIDTVKDAVSAFDHALSSAVAAQ